MNRNCLTAFALVFALVFVFAMSHAVRGQDNNDSYRAMAPLDLYLIGHDAEIALARSAAPESISRDARVLILGRHGYETAVEGKDGFTCIVQRSWMLPFDNPEFWNPKVRLPLCMNPPGSQFNLPLTFKTTELALEGVPITQISDRLKAAYGNQELPSPGAGAMCYMMSKQQYFSDKIGNARDSHLMFWFPRGQHVNWGADASDSPVDVHQYSPQPITEFSISISSGQMELPWRLTNTKKIQESASMFCPFLGALLASTRTD